MLKAVAKNFQQAVCIASTVENQAEFSRDISAILQFKPLPLLWLCSLDKPNQRIRKQAQIGNIHIAIVRIAT